MKSGFIYLNNNIIPSLLACSSEEQAVGLMHQEWPPPIMSFVYSSPQINKFWMKNTPSPLDIVFCYLGKISQICYGEPNSTSVIGNDYFSDLVIELPYGSVKSMGIKVGQEVGLIKKNFDELHKII